MYGKFQKQLKEELQVVKEAGLFKKERIIINPQAAVIKVSTGDDVLNFCANNYLGLSSHPKVIEASKKALDTHGFGLSSVRFILLKSEGSDLLIFFVPSFKLIIRENSF